VFGNNGKHINKAVNKLKNKTISADIVDALFRASDHLPVVINLKLLETK
jgi:exonuclease III